MSDMKTVQKIQNDKIFNENLILSDKPKKWPILQIGQMRFFMASTVKNGQIFRNWPWNSQSGNPGTTSVTAEQRHMHYNIVCVQTGQFS